MANNAQWWVTWTDKNHPDRRNVMSLASPDLANPKAAHKRARNTAKDRLVKKGLKPLILSSQCVG